MSDRDSAYGANQIKDRSLTQLELDLTNTPNNGQIIKINMPTGDFTAIDLGDIGDVVTMQTNIVLNAFRIAINGSLTQFNMVDGIVDEYEDENSIDNPNSTNESYDSVNDLYSPAGADNISASPFAHMVLENNTDDGSGANAVTDIGTPTYTVGKLNNALTLDGSTDALNLDALQVDIKTDTSGSITMWINPDVVNTDQFFFTLSDASAVTAFRVQVESNGIVRIQLQSGLTDWLIRSTTALSAGIWHHIVIVQDGVSPKIYLNGVDETVISTSNDLTVWFAKNSGVSDVARLGCENFNGGGNTRFFDGQIDDFRYYQNTALTQADVDLLYNSGSGTEETNPSSGSDNMTLQSISFPAEAQADNVRIVLFEEDVDTITLNTDLKAFVTRDAGQTFTTDFATDDKLDITSHGFSNDDRIMVTSSSQDLPAGLDSATVYYVINAITNDFELSLTSSGSAIDITDNGTGTHTAKQVSEITLANDGEYESGKNILTGSTDISGQPSGTSMVYNLITANKDLKIHGTSISWD